jgi:hypothetical protein
MPNHVLDPERVQIEQSLDRQGDLRVLGRDYTQILGNNLLILDGIAEGSELTHQQLQPQRKVLNCLIIVECN